MNVIDLFLASDIGLAVKGLLVASIVVFALGVTAALRDRTFDAKYIDAFVRSTIMGRVVPVLIVLLAGYIANEDLLTGGGLIAAAAVATGMIASALDSLSQLTKPVAESAAVNEAPVE